MKEFLDKLRCKSFEVIVEEQLPEPETINFRYSDKGVRTKKGSLHRYRNNDTYKIIIDMVEPRYVKDLKGKLLNRQTGERLRQVCGKVRTKAEVMAIVAHEIAHLKFWNHTSQHKSYTNHILEQLQIKMGDANE